MVAYEFAVEVEGEGESGASGTKKSCRSTSLAAGTADKKMGKNGSKRSTEARRARRGTRQWDTYLTWAARGC